MAQNNQGWRESHRYQNRQTFNDQWRENEDKHQYNRHPRPYGDRQNQYGQESLFHEDNYPQSQGYQSDWDRSENDDSQYRQRGYADRNREDDDRGYHRNNYNNERQREPQRFWSDRGDQHHYSDEQGYRNPAGGSAERYGSSSYDHNNRNESDWNRNEENRSSGGSYSGNRSNPGADRNNNQDRSSRNRMGQSMQDIQNQGMYSGKGPKGYKRSDERIQEEINDKLTYHGDLDASDIEVEVSQGEVTLSGTVNDRSGKRIAEDLAESVPGVQNVENRIRVQQQNSSSSTDSNEKDSANQKNKRMSMEGSLQDHADRKTTKTV